MRRCPPQKSSSLRRRRCLHHPPVGVNAAPAKSKTDSPAAGFGSKSIVLFSIISLFVFGFSGSYIYGRNSYIVRVSTDATFGYVPPSVGTVGGEFEAVVDEAEEASSDDEADSSYDEEEGTAGGEFEAVVDEAEEASSHDEEESPSDDEADSSYDEEEGTGGGEFEAVVNEAEESSSDDEEESSGDDEADSSYDEAEASLDKSPLQVGQIQPMQVMATGQIIADHVYRIGLPSSVRVALLKLIEETGILNEFYRINAHPVVQGESEYKTFGEQEWYVQRPPALWNSNMHWISPAGDAAQQRYLRALGDGGFDQVLDAIGQQFNMDGLTVYQLTLIGVSQSQDGYIHTDSSDTGAKVYNVIIPLELVTDADPELNVVDTEDEVIYEYKYGYDMGVMIGDDARHRTASVDYDSGAMRIAATVYLADINEDNVDEIIESSYTQVYPPRADREYLLARRGQHWGNDQQLPKTSFGEHHSEL